MLLAEDRKVLITRWERAGVKSALCESDLLAPVVHMHALKHVSYFVKNLEQWSQVSMSCLGNIDENIRVQMDQRDPADVYRVAESLILPLAAWIVLFDYAEPISLLIPYIFLRQAYVALHTYVQNCQ